MVMHFDRYMMPFTAPEIQAKLENEAENQLSSLVIRPKECIKIEADVREGIASVEIIEKAKDEDVDLIVMGSHGRTGFEHILLGSVVEKIIRNGPCLVLVVRNRETKYCDTVGWYNYQESLERIQ